MNQVESRDVNTDIIAEIVNANVYFEMEHGRTNVLNDVTIDIIRGETIGIVGESGSGKSMLAHALMDAIVEPGSLLGNITIHPKDDEPIKVTELTDEELRQFRWEKASMVFQGAMDSFNPTLSIKGHFEETLRSHEKSVDEGMDRAKHLLAQVYLNPNRVLDSYPHELSGGMKQRALIALSLILEPEILILDEPTSALDLLMQRSILAVIQRVKKEHDLTVIYISHDLPFVSLLADRIAVMYAFKIVEIARTKDIIGDAKHPYTRALFNSTPDIKADIEHMEPIEGSSPDPSTVPQGCSFHPRCPLATDECKTKSPPFESVRKGQRVACFHWTESSEKIPLKINEQSNE